jgi:hypothetical protein
MKVEKLDKNFKVSWIITVVSLFTFVFGIILFTWSSNAVVYYFALIFVIISLLGILGAFFIGKFGNKPNKK